MENTLFCSLMIILAGAQSIFSFLYPFLTVFFSFFLNIKIHKYIEIEKVNHISRYISNEGIAGTYNELDEPVGLVIGIRNKWPVYICWMSEDSYDKNVFMLCSGSERKRMLDSYTKDSAGQIFNDKYDENDNLCMDEQNSQKNKEILDPIPYYGRSGTYSYFRYSERPLFVNHLSRENQSLIIQEIKEKYLSQRFLTVFLHGIPGVGKSYTGHLLAKDLKGSFCDTFEPNVPGDSFENLYSMVGPTRKKPLVICLDDVDGLIRDCENKNIIHNDKIPIQVYNKSTWNRLLDRIDMGIFPYCILILCSNTSKNDIDKMDSSYLREGRVHLVKELVKKKIY